MFHRFQLSKMPSKSWCYLMQECFSVKIQKKRYMPYANVLIIVLYMFLQKRLGIDIAYEFSFGFWMHNFAQYPI